jgi:hypothetical protein
VGVRAQACACARVGLLIQYATRRLHIVCVLSGFTIFFDIVSKNGTIFEKKVAEHKMCFDLFYNVYLKYFSFEEEFSEILS